MMLGALAPGATGAAGRVLSDRMGALVCLFPPLARRPQRPPRDRCSEGSTENLPGQERAAYQDRPAPGESD